MSRLVTAIAPIASSLALLLVLACMLSAEGTFTAPAPAREKANCKARWRGEGKFQSSDFVDERLKRPIDLLDHASTTGFGARVERRQVFLSAAHLALIQPLTDPAQAHAEQTAPLPRGELIEVEDPDSYSAVAYIPPPSKERDGGPFPVLVVLHGAGNNDRSALDEFADPRGDHVNLPPYLLASHRSPPALAENFVVVAPYVGKGKRSLYDEPRGKILSFVRWFNSWVESQAFSGGTSGVAIDRRRISLLGFSEGATLAVELATTRQFNGVVVCSYGFTGVLPKMAIGRLQGIPMWVFHSRGDGVYDIQCSNRLVDGLMTYEGALDVFSVGNIVKYTKLIPPKNDDGKEERSVREHVRSALAASASNEVYTWLLSLQ